MQMNWLRGLVIAAGVTHIVIMADTRLHYGMRMGTGMNIW
jgi:hypothetical protein